MKTLECFAVFFIMICGGCSALVPTYGVRDNMVLSSAPQLALQVSADYEYARQKDEKNTELGGSGLVTTANNRYVFVNRLTRSTVVVHFSHVKGRYYFVDGGMDRSVLDSGHEEYRGDLYRYAVFANEEEEVDKCLLVKRIYRTAGVSNNVMINVVFLEELSGGKAVCAKWQNPEQLDDKQQERLKTFLEQAKQNIQFLDYATALQSD